MSDLDRLAEEIHEYDQPSQELYKSLQVADEQLDLIDSMKRTEGWKLVEKNIRKQLSDRILKLVEADAEIMTLLALLTFTDSKTQKKALREQIKSMLPEQSG